jgi:Ceramidase
MTLSKTTLSYLLIAVSAISGVALLFIKPIAQPAAFHQFADIRSIFSVANFWNVISNTVFFLIGITALQKLSSNRLAIMAPVKAAYYIFFTGVLLVAFGSAYYHYNPNNNTLVWDRLPMTIAFMSLLSFALAEFVSVNAGRRGLIPFLLTGIFSIAYWLYGEQHHNGDLRLYALVQFLPILLLLLLLVFGRSAYNTQWGYWVLFIAYIIAKLAEHFDVGIYNFTGELMAGHLLKHLLSALGLWLFLVYLGKRKLRG